MLKITKTHIVAHNIPILAPETVILVEIEDHC